MSDSQIRAMKYSQKCERRRQRVARQRVDRFTKMVNFTVPFAAGIMTIALMVAIAVQ